MMSPPFDQPARAREQVLVPAINQSTALARQIRGVRLISEVAGHDASRMAAIPCRENVRATPRTQPIVDAVNRLIMHHHHAEDRLGIDLFVRAFRNRRTDCRLREDALASHNEGRDRSRVSDPANSFGTNARNRVSRPRCAFDILPSPANLFRCENRYTSRTTP